MYSALIPSSFWAFCSPSHTPWLKDWSLTPPSSVTKPTFTSVLASVLSFLVAFSALLSASFLFPPPHATSVIAINNTASKVSFFFINKSSYLCLIKLYIIVTFISILYENKNFLEKVFTNLPIKKAQLSWAFNNILLFFFILWKLLVS